MGVLGGIRIRSLVNHRAHCGVRPVLIIRGRAAILAAAALAFFLDAPPVLAQPEQPTALRPSIAIPHIEFAEAPEIDADLSDAAWAKAALITDFRQSQPDTGEPVTERTELRIMYDENNIYFGVHAFDQTPERVLARGMARDGNLNAGDFVRIVIDPGATRRNGYSFQVGASGGRVDSIIQNNSTNLTQWDTIWAASSRRTDDGWMTEVAIPFRSLSVEPDATDWGFEFTRNIRHKNEGARWSNFSPNIPFTDLTQAGTLTGIRPTSTGLGLDLKFYGKGQYTRDWQIEDSGSITGTGGGNIYYKFTPALTGTLTFNPDFSDAPLDNVQINTTRFSLFTAETRDFFLQDAPAFEFGGRNFAGGGGFAAFGGNNNGRPFFSRNIGLARGTPVTIIGGAKLSGSYGGFGIGGISAYTEATGTVPRQLLSVLRVSRPVLAESKLGFIVTNGDPTGASDNTTGGADFQYRNSNLTGVDDIFQADAFYTRSFSSTHSQDDSFGLALAYPDEPLSADIRFLELGADFRPALGFANRLGIRQYAGNITHTTRYRDYFLRMFEISTTHDFITDLSNHLESRENSVSLNAQAPTEDRVDFSVTNNYEDIPEEFDLPNDIPVGVGQYTWTNFRVGLNMSQARVLAVGGNITCCDFYDGQELQIQLNVNYRPNTYIELMPRYNIRFITMPTGETTIHVPSMSATINFTPDMQLAIQMQYDTVSENFGSLARYRWEYAPGDELFVSFGQGAIIDDRGFTFRASQFTVRLGQTFQF
jgi:hypothetical protein